MCPRAGSTFPSQAPALLPGVSAQIRRPVSPEALELCEPLARLSKPPLSHSSERLRLISCSRSEKQAVSSSVLGLPPGDHSVQTPRSLPRAVVSPELPSEIELKSELCKLPYESLCPPQLGPRGGGFTGARAEFSQTGAL